MTRRTPRTHGALGVWMNGDQVGEWVVAANQPSTFNYADQWTRSPLGRPLSLSLPFLPGNQIHRGAAVDFYFDNLLPESDAIRRRIQNELKIRSTSAFDMLAVIGRDCVGAVQLLPAGEQPEGWDRIEATPVTDEAIEQLLLHRAADTTNPAAKTDYFRISALAGMQEKLALLQHDQHWCLPQRSTPSTHILKPAIGVIEATGYDMRASVENEWLCGRIVNAFGLPVADSTMATFGATRTLVVRRFDRQLASSGDYWLRLPQEDLCQALGVAPTMKYESEGGPGMRQVLDVLASSERAELDRTNFLKTQLVFWMLAATDGHAKNFSLRINARGTFHATPLYDVLSVWPIIGTGRKQLARQDARLAMAVRGRNVHYHLDEIQRRHWSELARTSGVGANAEPVIEALLTAVPGVIQAINAALPAGFPATVSDRILEGLHRSAQKLAAMPA